MRKLVWLYLPVFLTPLVFNPWGLKPYEIAKQGWFLLFVGIFLIGATILFWQKSYLEFPKNQTFWIVVSLWILSYVISTIFSIAPRESFWGNYEQMQGLFIHLFYVLHFLMLWYLFDDLQWTRTFFLITLVVGLLLSLHALFQRLGIDPILHDADFFPGRSFSLMGSPNALGEFLIFPFFAAVFFIKEYTGDRKRLFLFSLLAIFIFLGMWATYNRASLLGVGVLFILLIYEQKWRLRTKIFCIIGGIIIASIIFGFLLTDMRSLGTRSILWLQSLSLIPHYFFFGSGLSTYYQTIQTVLTPNIYLYERMSDIPLNVHNETLAIFLERGIIGFLLYVLNFFFLVWLFLKQKLQTNAGKIAFISIVASLITFQFGFPLTTHILLLLAMWVILLKETIHFKVTKIAFRTPVKVGGSIILLAIAFIALNHGYKTMYADNLLGKGVSAYVQGDDQQSLTFFERSFFLNPYYVYPYRTAFFFFKPFSIQQLSLWNQRIGAISNNGFQYELDRAELALRNNDMRTAEKFFLDAKVKASHWPILWETWGELWFEREDYPKAIVAFEKLRDLAPPYWQWKVDIGKRPPKEQEQYRIFRITHDRFYEMMEYLAESYKKVGRTQEAARLEMSL